MKLVDGKGGVELYTGSELVSTNGGYDLVVDHDAREMLQEKLNQRKVFPDPIQYSFELTQDLFDTGERDHLITDEGKLYLSDALENNAGVCKENAATATLILQELGMEPEYVKGIGENSVDRGSHAWAKVNDMLVDPSLGRMGDYDTLQSRHNYLETENPVKQPSYEEAISNSESIPELRQVVEEHGSIISENSGKEYAANEIKYQLGVLKNSGDYDFSNLTRTKGLRQKAMKLD